MTSTQRNKGPARDPLTVCNGHRGYHKEDPRALPSSILDTVSEHNFYGPSCGHTQRETRSLAEGRKKDEEKPPDVKDILGLKIFGIDLGGLLKNWLGVSDLNILQDPSQAEAIKKRIELEREKLKEAQEQLRRRFGDAIRFDYDIRVRSLLGGEEEVRLGGGRFFERLDELARARTERRKVGEKPAPYVRREGVIEPTTEVIEEEEYVEVIAELPGVEEKDIEVKAQEEKLLISTAGVERRYQGEVRLPSKVFEELVEKSYRNGVLRVRLKKSQKPHDP